MIPIFDSKRRHVLIDVLDHKTTTRDDQEVHGTIRNARVEELGGGGKWFILLTLEDESGAQQDVQLKQSGGLLQKPFLPLYASVEEAQEAADQINNLVSAYQDGRIKWREVDDGTCDRTYVIEVKYPDDDGQEVYKNDIAYTLREARSQVELAFADPNRRDISVSVHEYEGTLPSFPLGRLVDFEDVKVWMKENLEPDLILILEETQFNHVTYRPVEVESVNLNRGEFRIHPGVHSGGVVFKVTGKDSYHPKGQTRILPPIHEAVAAAVNRRAWHLGQETASGRPDSEYESELRKKLAQYKQSTIIWAWTHPNPGDRRQSIEPAPSF